MDISTCANYVTIDPDCGKECGCYGVWLEVEAVDKLIAKLQAARDAVMAAQTEVPQP